METLKVSTQDLSSIVLQMKDGISKYDNGIVTANIKRIHAVRDAIVHLETLLQKRELS